MKRSLPLETYVFETFVLIYALVVFIFLLFVDYFSLSCLCYTATSN